MNYIEPTNRNQYTFASCLNDMIEKDNPVRIIDITVESIVESSRDIFYKQKESEVGPPSYRPTTMLKIYMYGYFNSITSSRKLEREAGRNIELKWLLGDLQPDHWTISTYRKNNEEQIKYVTKRFREFLIDKEYAEVKTVSVDGSKVKANATKDMLTNEKIIKRIEGMEKQIEEYLKKLKDNDSKEDIIEEYESKGQNNINEALLEEVSKLRAKIEELSKSKDDLDRSGKKAISKTDPECNLMKSRDGKIPAYNVQVAVEEKNKFIIDSEVVTDENDYGMLEEMVKSIKEETGEYPEEILADAGYQNPDIIETIEKIETEENISAEINCYVPIARSQREKEEINFSYDVEKDEYLCSEGKRLVLIARNKKKKNTRADVYQCKECSNCFIREKCTKSKKGRIYHRYHNQEWRENFKEKMKEQESVKKIKSRKGMIEHVFGSIKISMGKIPLLLRGIRKVSTEINLHTTVYNLKRLMNIDTIDNIIENMKQYIWKVA